MSILVLGMEIPKGCRDCKLNERGQDGIYCKVTNDFEWDENRQFKPWKHRMNTCPLVKIKSPHGRLIDANKVVKASDSLPEGTDITIVLEEVKTVIEAEE